MSTPIPSDGKGTDDAAEKVEDDEEDEDEENDDDADEEDDAVDSDSSPGHLCIDPTPPLPTSPPPPPPPPPPPAASAMISRSAFTSCVVCSCWYFTRACKSFTWSFTFITCRPDASLSSPLCVPLAPVAPLVPCAPLVVIPSPLHPPQPPPLLWEDSPCLLWLMGGGLRGPCGIDCACVCVCRWEVQ